MKKDVRDIELKRFLEKKRDVIRSSCKGIESINENHRFRLGKISKNSLLANTIYRGEIRKLEDFIHNDEELLKKKNRQVKLINEFLDVFEQPKIKSMPLAYVLWILNLAYGSFTDTYLVKTFGKLSTQFDKQRKGSNLCYFSGYFNEDGSLKYNSNVEYFGFLFDCLVDLIEIKSSRREYNVIIDAFCNALINSNKEHERNKAKATEKIVAAEGKGEEPACFRELKRFYSNYQIHNIPRSISEFIALMRDCSYSEEEIRYATSLIFESKSAEKAEPIDFAVVFQHFTSEEREVANLFLNKAKENARHRYMPFYYYSLLDAISECIQNPNNINLIEKRNAALENLKMFLNYKAKEVENGSPLLLLENETGSHLLDDILALPTGLRKEFSYLLEHKLNEQNIRRSPFVIRNANVTYPIYNVVYKNISVYVLELNGAYLLVGASIFGYGEDVIQARVLECEDAIGILEKQMETEGIDAVLSKHALLISQLKYILANKEKFSRVREKKAKEVL